MSSSKHMLTGQPPTVHSSGVPYHSLPQSSLLSFITRKILSSALKKSSTSNAVQRSAHVQAAVVANPVPKQDEPVVYKPAVTLFDTRTELHVSAFVDTTVTPRRAQNAVFNPEYHASNSSKELGWHRPVVHESQDKVQKQGTQVERSGLGKGNHQQQDNRLLCATSAQQMTQSTGTQGQPAFSQRHLQADSQPVAAGLSAKSKDTRNTATKNSASLASPKQQASTRHMQLLELFGGAQDAEPLHSQTNPTSKQAKPSQVAVQPESRGTTTLQSRAQQRTATTPSPPVSQSTVPASLPLPAHPARPSAATIAAPQNSAALATLHRTGESSLSQNTTSSSHASGSNIARVNAATLNASQTLVAPTMNSSHATQLHGMAPSSSSYQPGGVAGMGSPLSAIVYRAGSSGANSSHTGNSKRMLVSMTNSSHVPDHSASSNNSHSSPPTSVPSLISNGAGSPPWSGSIGNDKPSQNVYMAPDNTSHRDRVGSVVDVSPTYNVNSSLYGNGLGNGTASTAASPAWVNGNTSKKALDSTSIADHSLDHLGGAVDESHVYSSSASSTGPPSILKINTLPAHPNSFEASISDDGSQVEVPQHTTGERFAGNHEKQFQPLGQQEQVQTAPQHNTTSSHRAGMAPAGDASGHGTSSDNDSRCSSNDPMQPTSHRTPTVPATPQALQSLASPALITTPPSYSTTGQALLVLPLPPPPARKTPAPSVAPPAASHRQEHHSNRSHGNHSHKHQALQKQPADSKPTPASPYVPPVNTQFDNIGAAAQIPHRQETQKAKASTDTIAKALAAAFNQPLQTSAQAPNPASGVIAKQRQPSSVPSKPEAKQVSQPQPQSAHSTPSISQQQKCKRHGRKEQKVHAEELTAEPMQGLPGPLDSPTIQLTEADRELGRVKLKALQACNTVATAGSCILSCTADLAGVGFLFQVLVSADEEWQQQVRRGARRPQQMLAFQCTMKFDKGSSDASPSSSLFVTVSTVSTTAVEPLLQQQPSGLRVFGIRNSTTAPRLAAGIIQQVATTGQCRTTSASAVARLTTCTALACASDSIVMHKDLRLVCLLRPMQVWHNQAVIPGHQLYILLGKVDDSGQLVLGADWL